jgi:Ca2+-binding RTX toxin-like protein
MRSVSRISLAVVVGAAPLLLVAPTALAAPVDCQYTKTKKLVTLSIDNTSSTGDLVIERALGTNKIGYQREGFSWSGCEGARTTDTNKIKVVGSTLSEDITINLENGPFAPGASSESSGSSEIEFELDLGSGTDRVTLLGGNGADRLGFVKPGQASLNGDSDVDVEMSGINIWTLDGGAGNDLLNGRGAPSVEIWGREGDDRLVGGPGSDDLYGDSGASPTGDGNDMLVGGGDDDYLRGYRGRDTLQGSDGDDSLYADEGNDDVMGGPGNDYVGAMAGKDGADDLDGGTGNDTVSYWYRSKNVRMLLDGKANDGGKNEKDDIARNIERLDAGSGNDTLVGNSAGNSLYGNDGNDDLRGLGGDDSLDDGAGNDKLTGGPGDDSFGSELGDDQVVGGEGNDSVYAGSSADGSDVLSGGTGRDTVNYQSRTNALTLLLNDTDANDGEVGENDKVKGDFEYIYAGNGSDQIRGSNLSEYITGGGSTGVDNINGRGGADRIYGNDGNDLLTGGADFDEVYGSNGDDTIWTQDQSEDYVDCGPGALDTLSTADAFDTFYNCESAPL